VAVGITWFRIGIPAVDKIDDPDAAVIHVKITEVGPRYGPHRRHFQRHPSYAGKGVARYQW
jgi:hypothetical protein